MRRGRRGERRKVERGRGKGRGGYRDRTGGTCGVQRHSGIQITTASANDRSLLSGGKKAIPRRSRDPVEYGVHSRTAHT